MKGFFVRMINLLIRMAKYFVVVTLVFERKLKASKVQHNSSLHEKLHTKHNRGLYW